MLFRNLVWIVILAIGSLVQPVSAAKPASGESGECFLGGAGCKTPPASNRSRLLPEPTETIAPTCSILGNWKNGNLSSQTITFYNDGTATALNPRGCTGDIPGTFWPNGNNYDTDFDWAGGQQCISATARWIFLAGCNLADVHFENADGVTGITRFSRTSTPDIRALDIDAAATGVADHISIGNSAQAPATTCGGEGGCATWTVAPLTVSLGLHDMPLRYQPPRGPAFEFHLYYSHRDIQQPLVFSYGNFGPQWTTNWLSYVTDDVTVNGRAKLYQRGGGAENYGFGSPDSLSSLPGAYSQATLRRHLDTDGKTLGFTRLLNDGSSEEFNRAAGALLFMTAVIDPQGNRVELEYDARMRLVALKDAIGQITTLSYEASDPLKITKVTDPFGRSALFTYTAQGRLASITDTIGLTSSFTYDFVGHFVNTLTTPYGTTRFAFTGTTANPSRNLNRTLQVTDPLGQITRIAYGHHYPRNAETDDIAPAGMFGANTELNTRNTYIWDPVQYLQYRRPGLDTTNATVIHWLRDIDTRAVSRVIGSIKEPLERRVWFSYPGQPNTRTVGASNLPSRIARVLDDGSTQAAAFTYNAIGKPLTVTDPRGRQTTYTYDESGIDLQTIANTTAGVNRLLASFTYNAQHLPLTVKDAAGQTTTFTYNPAGQRLSMTDALTRATRYLYDSSSYLTGVLNANGKSALRLTYDAVGRIATRTDSEGHVTAFQYDNFDRITRAGFPDGTSTVYGWNKLDLAAITDRQGRKTAYAYDANRRLITVTDPLGQITRYGYHGNDALKEITDPNGNVTTWDVDSQGRVTTKRYADGSENTTAYENTTSRVKALSDALGQVKTFSYGLDDRLTRIAYDNAVKPTPNVTFTYDTVFPRVTSMTDGNGTTQYQYHSVGSVGALQLASEDGPFQNDTIAYQHDALGRVTSRSVATSPESFAYDALGRMNSHTNALGAFTQSYLGETGQLLRQQSSVGGVGTRWTYDTNANDRRLKSILNNGATRSYQYTTTPENLINGINELAGPASAFAPKAWTYRYDAADRLVSGQAADAAPYTYQLDPADNITASQTPTGNRSAIYNTVNQLTRVDTQPLVYDDAGNLLDDGQRSYQWDAEQRLVAIGYKAQPGQRTTFRYDGLGRRSAIIETSTTGTVETRQLWCGTSLCQARTDKDVVSRRYFDEGETRPGAGTLLYYARDHLGSVRDVLVAQNGARVASYDYDPYGKPTQSAGRISVDRRYAGMFYHQASGLYLTQYRAYDPRTARWLSRDPIEEEGGLNLYGYVEVNPLNKIDPSGQAPCPATPPVGDNGWEPYKGNPEVFHCGFPTFLENRDPSRSNRIAECAYDATGSLVGKGHPFAGCRGTPDQYTLDQYGGFGTVLHTVFDDGGPAYNLVDPWLTSRRYGELVEKGLEAKPQANMCTISTRRYLENLWGIP